MSLRRNKRGRFVDKLLPNYVANDPRVIDAKRKVADGSMTRQRLFEVIHEVMGLCKNCGAPSVGGLLCERHAARAKQFFATAKAQRAANRVLDSMEKERPVVRSQLPASFQVHHTNVRAVMNQALSFKPAKPPSKGAATGADINGVTIEHDVREGGS